MIDLQLQAIVEHARAAGMPDLADLPPEPCRRLYRQILAAADVPPADVQVSQTTLEVEPGVEIPLRVYMPNMAGPHPLVVYFHGGGYVLGDLDGYDNVCRRLCNDAQAVVMSVGYRLAPEHPFPAAADDAWAALRWAAAHGADYGADPARLAVAGDSAGAVLATAVAMMARDAGAPAIRYQALVYPPAAGGADGDFPSRQRHAQGPTLTARTMDYFNRHCFGPQAKAPDFRGAPLAAANLSGLPPALVQVAALDPLRDEALAYAAALQQAGNLVSVVEYHGLAHGYISMAGRIDAARLALRQFALAIEEALI